MQVVKKVVGYEDDECKKVVFKRDARDYDQKISSATIFSIPIGDIIKAVPVFFLAGYVWANQQNFNRDVLETQNKQAEAILSIKVTLGHIDNYFSSKTGKQFQDGEPIQ